MNIEDMKALLKARIDKEFTYIKVIDPTDKKIADLLSVLRESLK